MLKNDGDLVITGDGYYGIVTDAIQRMVFLSNGLEERMDQTRWRQLESLPMVRGEDLSSANFFELVERRRALEQILGHAAPHSRTLAAGPCTEGEGS